MTTTAPDRTGRSCNADEVIVVGGGIGGLTTALALARGGRPVLVLERADAFTEIGAGLQLAPNATRVLDRLGVLERVVAAGVLPRRLVFHSALSGRELTHLDLGDACRERYGGPYVVLHRSDLLAILVDACRAAGVALENGRHVVSVTDEPDRAVVTCADGAAYEGALAVGADGLRSGVRSRFSDDEPVCSGYVAYRGAVPMEQVSGAGELHDVRVWFGPGLHLVQYPLRTGSLFNQVAVFRSPRHAAGDTEWGTPDELDEVFSATCAQVREAVPALWRHMRWPMYDREPLDTWAAGRTVLLGDAAHPMLQYLAQGACQAIEDAVALVRALDGAAGGLGAALKTYEEQRVPRTTRVQRTARVWGDIWHVEGVAALLRDELFVQRRPDDHRHVDWLYGTAAG
ncbi:FAD-dependent monooxygenase [Streptomyces formicae]|uniref:FAD-dependent monooxygenase n=1 Tax=Streptomyces formicae TaxID=1616117 RepID=A0ABY3WK77_9ACTN|nr:FAD-dependent monooxygenase [Streptomyces formicae]UNM13009.1 FAD-dependent monooxygenase [Streptomyces formicae]